MDGTANRTAGLVPDDTSGAADHQRRPRSRVSECIKAAIEILEGSNRQETQQARIVLEEALIRIEEVEAAR